METGVKTNIRPSVSRVGRGNISRSPEDPETDKRKSLQPEHPECIGDKERQVGDKCKSMQPEHPECIGDKERQGGGKPEYGRQGRQVGDKCAITRPEQQSVLETGRRGRQVTSGRQV